MQVTVAQPPQAPAAATQPGAFAISAGELTGRPVTKADVDALKAKRSELSRQINSVQGRRDEAVKALQNSEEGVPRQGLEQRISVLDERLVQLERDIAVNGRQLAAAPSALLAATEGDAPQAQERSQPSASQWTAMGIVFTIAVLMPMAIAFGRSLLRRSTVPPPSPQLRENTQRLERMEQALDSVAIEIERISEGQRFVTQLMAKRAEPVALSEGAAPAQPIVAQQAQPVVFERR